MPVPLLVVHSGRIAQRGRDPDVGEVPEEICSRLCLADILRPRLHGYHGGGTPVPRPPEPLVVVAADGGGETVPPAQLADRAGLAVVTREYDGLGPLAGGE